MFVAIMSYAMLALFSEYAPGLPGWLKMTLAIAFPLLWILGVGVYGALHDHPRTAPLIRQWSRRIHLVVIMIVGAVVVWRTLVP